MKKLFQKIVKSKVGRIIITGLLEEAFLKLRMKKNLYELVTLNNAIAEIEKEIISEILGDAKASGTEN